LQTKSADQRLKFIAFIVPASVILMLFCFNLTNIPYRVKNKTYKMDNLHTEFDLSASSFYFPTEVLLPLVTSAADGPKEQKPLIEPMGSK
jgi:Na+/proline symporter